MALFISPPKTKPFVCSLFSPSKLLHCGNELKCVEVEIVLLACRDFKEDEDRGIKHVRSGIRIEEDKKMVFLKTDTKARERDFTLAKSFAI